MTAVSEHGYSLEYASEELRGDPEIVLKAMSQNGALLRFARDDLRGDREMVRRSEICQEPQPECTAVAVIWLQKAAN